MNEGSIQFFSDDVDFVLPKQEEHKEWLMSLLKEEGELLAEVNCVFVSDDALLEMNRKHLSHDYYTDIITFEYTTDEGVQGELYISIDRVVENAQKINEKLENEVDRVICHGFLHLVGYKDKSENQQREMRSKEDYYLNLRPFVSRGT